MSMNTYRVVLVTHKPREVANTRTFIVEAESLETALRAGCAKAREQGYLVDERSRSTSVSLETKRLKSREDCETFEELLELFHRGKVEGEVRRVRVDWSYTGKFRVDVAREHRERMWETFGYGDTLHHAFREALSPFLQHYDGEIDRDSLQTFPPHCDECGRYYERVGARCTWDGCVGRAVWET